MHLDEERDDDGNVRRQGQDYYLKPMNCPMHCLIFASRGRSYRELPLRLFEFGTVYRYEKSGVVHGLTRVRGLTQDDAHIYCTQEQIGASWNALLTFVLNLLADYGLEDFYLELSTRDPDKSIGDDEAWEVATRTLREVADGPVSSWCSTRAARPSTARRSPSRPATRSGAPGRCRRSSWTSFSPSGSSWSTTAPDGSRQRPVMIHRALFGSIERFFGVLTEHYAGAFPAWLAPVQVIGCRSRTSSTSTSPACSTKLKARGVRVEVDTSDDRMRQEDPQRGQGEGAVHADRRWR